MANRVQDAIDKLRDNPGLGSIPDDSTVIDRESYTLFQDTQSIAFAGQKLTMDEAWLVHNALGYTFTEANDGWAHHADKATKVTVLRLMAELIGVVEGSR